jgi:hypothetical protein
LQLAAAACAQALSHLASAASTDEVTKAVASLNSKVSAALAAVSKDNELVYHEKVPDASALPTVDAKVLVKALPVDGVFDHLADGPLPSAIRRPDEEGAGEPLCALFCRLGSEFKMIPLSERQALAQAEGLADAKPTAKPASAGKERSSGDSKVGERLTSLFTRTTKSSGSGSSKASSAAKSKAGEAPSQEEEDEEEKALQAALEASLKELPPPDVHMPASANHHSPPSMSPTKNPRDILSRSLSNRSSFGAAPPPPSMPPPPPPPPPSGDPPPPSFEAASAMPSVAEVEGLVKQLVGMGFGRDQALDALRASSYDLSTAANRLLQ